MSGLQDAYRLLAAESGIWAMEPVALEGLAVALARGDKLAARRGAAPAMRPGATAVIPIVGPLSRRPSLFSRLLGLGDSGTYQGISRALADALADRQVKGILLQIDSPGGTVGGLPELADEIARAGKIKPVTAIADGLAASAAYWLGSQATRFVATPSGELGSIGVFLLHVDASRGIDAEGLTPIYITSGTRAVLHLIFALFFIFLHLTISNIVPLVSADSVGRPSGRVESWQASPVAHWPAQPPRRARLARSPAG